MMQVKINKSFIKLLFLSYFYNQSGIINMLNLFRVSIDTPLISISNFSIGIFFSSCYFVWFYVSLFVTLKKENTENKRLLARSKLILMKCKK